MPITNGTILNPIELDLLEEFIPEVTKLITETRIFLTTFENDPIKATLINSCRMGQVPYGYGCVYDFKVAMQTVRDLDRQGTVLDEELPNSIQETLVGFEYKYVLLTMRDEVIRQSRASETGVSDYVAFLMGLAPETVEDYLYYRLLNMIKTWDTADGSKNNGKPALQATQKLNIELVDMGALSGNDLLGQELWNSKQIVKKVDELATDMTRRTTKYQERLQFKDANTGQMRNIETQTPKRNMRLIANRRHMRNIQADTLAMLYNPNDVSSLLPSDGLIEIPDGDINDANTFGWFGHKNKFALRDFYRIAETFRNGARLSTNYYDHFAIIVDYFQTAPMVKITVSYVTPAILKERLTKKAKVEKLDQDEQKALQALEEMKVA